MTQCVVLCRVCGGRTRRRAHASSRSRVPPGLEQEKEEQVRRVLARLLLVCMPDAWVMMMAVMDHGRIP
jgi:hypothetical protein